MPSIYDLTDEELDALYEYVDSFEIKEQSLG